MAPTRPPSDSVLESSRKRHPVTELERQKIRKYQQDNPGISQRKIAAWASNEFQRNISQSIVSATVTPKADKYDYLDNKEFAHGTVGAARIFQADFPDLENALAEWAIWMEGNVAVIGDMIKACAHEIFNKMSQHVGKKEPKWSDKWLYDFKKRHGIQKKKQRWFTPDVMEGPESENRLAECQELAKTYRFDDVYNADEMVLSWLVVPDGVSEKTKQERLTVLVTTNCSGSHRMHHWIIGNTQNPLSFGHKNCKIKDEPMVWRSNKKAWVTGKIWIEYLTWFAKEIRKRHSREVLLFVDSFSSHCSALRQLVESDSELPANERVLRQVRVEFLPKNATHLYQPCDQGIITNLKALYKKEWLTFMVTSNLSDKDPIKLMTHLRAVRWINSVWKDAMKPETIHSSWVKSQLVGTQGGTDPGPVDLDEDISEVARLMQDLRECLGLGGPRVTIADAESFINQDQEQVVDFRPEEVLDHVVALFSPTNQDVKGDDESGCDTAAEDISAKQTMEAMSTALSWLEEQSAGHQGTTITGLRRALREVNREVLAKKSEQARSIGMDLE